MRAAAIAFAVAAGISGGCRHPPPPALGAVKPAPHYAKLFHAFKVWTYRIAAEAAPEEDVADQAAPTATVEMTCRADEVHQFHGGVVARISCRIPHGLLDEGGAIPLEGVWLANEYGLWRVPRGAEAKFPENATMIIPAKPKAGKVPYDELTGDDVAVEVVRDGDGWCSVHHQHTDGDSYYTLCFGVPGVTSGGFGYTDDGGLHETKFELAP